ncbi:hypothetical protein QCA50_013838 [Cerrena zonata]|uniref:F-box domain-containing protein n=1 Tax=Cerrena zonata TaxID=2478898 RepID=A0AAW0FW85_9APHY
MISTLEKDGAFMHTLSASHRVLYNMDILHNIIGTMFYISRNNNDVRLERNGDICGVARLARVCKSFHEPALDRLWKEMLNLQPVHLLWNASLFPCNSPDDKEQSLHRLYYYTKRMKYVRYTEKEGTECDLLKIHQLHHLCKGRPLFPSIRSLDLCVWPLSASEMDLFFHPNLQYIDIRRLLNRPPRTLSFTKLARVQQEQMCLHLLVKRCPELREITDYDHQVTARIQGVLFDLERLSTISRIFQRPTTPSRRDKWLEKMSVLKHLTSLDFHIKIYPDDAISQLDLGPFSCLESLSIKGSVSMLSSIFGAMRNQLKKVFIETGIVEGWRMEQCMQLLVCNSDKMLSRFALQSTKKPLYYDSGSTGFPINPAMVYAPATHSTSQFRDRDGLRALRCDVS